ncbi:AzlD domain-containing protein [Chloroflexota bacterium]
MSVCVLIVGLSVLVYLVRLAGFCLPAGVKVSGFWSDFLNMIPKAAFSTLLVSSFTSTGEEGWIKFCGLGVAGMVALLTKQLGVSILCGLLIVWLLT